MFQKAACSVNFCATHSRSRWTVVDICLSNPPAPMFMVTKSTPPRAAAGLAACHDAAAAGWGNAKPDMLAGLR